MSESMGRTVTYFVVFAAAADGSARKTVQIYGEGKCTCHYKHGTKKKKHRVSQENCEVKASCLNLSYN